MFVDDDVLNLCYASAFRAFKVSRVGSSLNVVLCVCVGVNIRCLCVCLIFLLVFINVFVVIDVWLKLM